MAMDSAYWINSNGQILNFSTQKHIDAVVSAPEKFGVTPEYIKKKFAETGEPVGFEGKARENIIRDIIKLGFIRIRLYNANRQQFWSVTLNKLDEKTEQALLAWANIAKDDKQAGKYADVKILELSTGEQTKYTINEIINQFDYVDDNDDDDLGYNPNDFNWTKFSQVNSVHEFVTPILTLRQYILLS